MKVSLNHGSLSGSNETSTSSVDGALLLPPRTSAPAPRGPPAPPQAASAAPDKLAPPITAARRVLRRLNSPSVMRASSLQLPEWLNVRAGERLRSGRVPAILCPAGAPV